MLALLLSIIVKYILNIRRKLNEHIELKGFNGFTLVLKKGNSK